MPPAHPITALGRLYTIFAAKRRKLRSSEARPDSLSNYANIPPLKVNSGEVVDNLEKAKVFRDTFFPQTAAPIRETARPRKREIPWEPITEKEVLTALNSASSTTAPGEDRIPTLVWKKLWKFIQKPVFSIFSASIRLGY